MDLMPVRDDISDRPASMINHKQLLLVEDDEAVASAVRLHLEQAGFACTVENNGATAVTRVAQQRWDLMLLDLGLPGLDGLDVCRKVRALRPDLPVIILSARSHEAHKVLGLELGADDYLTKPFSMVELAARVRSLLRRLDQIKQNPQQQVLELGSTMKIDPTKRQVWISGLDVELTLREFDLLHFLATHPQRAFSRAELIEQVWGASFDGYEHAVNSHINRLRAKIEKDPRDPQWVLTVWGMGYRFQIPTSC
jgi:DNA-binding response OmpR family regulator